MKSIDTLLKALGVEPLTEQLMKLRKIEPLEVELEVEKHEDAKELVEVVRLLSKASKDRIQYRITRKRFPLETPPPCLKVAKESKSFAYCGYLDDFLLPIVVEALLALGGVIKPSCPSVVKSREGEAPKVRLYVVSGIPCIISGVRLAEYLACRDFFLEVVHAVSFNNRIGRRVVRSVPLIVVDNRVFYEGTVTSLSQIDEILRR